MHFRRLGTFKNARKAGHSLFGKNIGQAAAEVFSRRYRILRYREIDLGFGELKHEIIRKPINIALNLLTQTDGFDLIKPRDIFVEYDLLRPDQAVYGTDTTATIWATQAVSFRAVGRCRNSLGPWALAFGPSTPVTMNWASG
jgi:hypothetical protein